MIGLETTSHQLFACHSGSPALTWSGLLLLFTSASCGRPSDLMREQQHLRKRKRQRRKTLLNTTYWKHTGFIFSLWLSPDFYYVWRHYFNVQIRWDGDREASGLCFRHIKFDDIKRTAAAEDSGLVISRCSHRTNYLQGLHEIELVPGVKAWKAREVKSH